MFRKKQISFGWFTTVFFLISIFISSCSKDDFAATPTRVVKGHALTGAIIKSSALPRHVGVSSEIAVLTAPSLNKSGGAGLPGFQIDTTYIKMLESSYYKSYTFQVVQDSIERQSVLKNYVLTVFNDSTIHQLTVDYPVNPDGTYNVDQSVVRPYNGSALYKNDVNGCGWMEIAVTSWQETCIETRCSSGEHGWGEPCRFYGRVGMATRTCTGGWVTLCQSGGGTGSPGDIGGTNPGGGGDSGGGDGTSTQLDNSYPNELGISPNDGSNVTITLEKECEKIANNLKSKDSTSITARYKEKLRQMADSVVIYAAEVSYGMFENDRNIERRGGVAMAAANSMNANPSSKYTSYAHVHNDDAIGTLSVFSIDDLLAFAQQISYDNINTNKFTAFLSTHHGTDGQHFALTINDVPKFRAFFNTQFPYTAPNNYDAQQLASHNTLIKNSDKNHIFTKWKYWGDVNPLISHTATDVDDQLKKFMQFLDEADMGVELFKTNKNFDNFKKLSYDSITNQIKEKSC